MLRKLSTVMVAAYLLLALCACDGRSGSSGVLPSDDDSSPTATTVKAKVALNYTAARAAVGPLAVDPIEEAYQSAVVTLTLPDGRTFTMSYTGNGEYSCIVTNLPNGVAGYIEAEINDMVLRSFFDGLFAREAVLDTGDIGADSTFAADVLTSFAQALSGSELDPFAILSGVTDATLNIDIQSLNASATDGSTVEYELARRVYDNVLTWDNIDLTTGEIDGLISGEPAVQNLRDQIEAGVLVAPALGGPVEEAKLFAAGFLDAYFNERSSTALLPHIAPSDFLWSGLDATGFAAQVSTRWSSEPLFTESTSADFTNTIYSVSPAADFTGTGLEMFAVSLEGTFDLTLENGTVVTRSYGGQLKRFYVAKVTVGEVEKWLTFGDRKMMVFDYQIGYFNSNDPGRFTEIVVSAYAGGEMPTGVVADLGFIDYAVNAVPSDPRTFRFKLTGSPTTNWKYSTEGFEADTGAAFMELDGEVLTLDAAFSDADNTTFRKVFEIRSPTTVVTEFTQNADGSIYVEWRPPAVDERLLRVEVSMPRNGLSYSLPPGERSLTIPAADLTAAGVVPTFPNHLDVVYFTPTAQYGYREFFSWVGP